jgi:adenine/guanine phosphoribosyltransferase-like PRPP-binding protein
MTRPFLFGAETRTMASKKERKTPKKVSQAAANGTPLAQPGAEQADERRAMSREEIKAKMLEYAEEGMKEYHEALKELAK